MHGGFRVEKGVLPIPPIGIFEDHNAPSRGALLLDSRAIESPLTLSEEEQNVMHSGTSEMEGVPS